MDYQALFGVVVRAFGLVLIWDGFYEGLFATLQKAGVNRSTYYPPASHAIFAAAYVLAGVIAIKGVPQTAS
jgi:hypothetical protein